MTTTYPIPAIPIATLLWECRHARPIDGVDRRGHRASLAAGGSMYLVAVTWWDGTEAALPRGMFRRVGPLSETWQGQPCCRVRRGGREVLVLVDGREIERYELPTPHQVSRLRHS